MKLKANQIRIGMVLSYANLIIGNLIPLFYTPIMLELLGQSEYGLYKIAASTTAYLTIMNFGLGSAVSRFLIKANVEGGQDSEEKTLGLFDVIFKIISVATLVVGGIIVFVLPLFYSDSLSDDELVRMQIIVVLMVVNTAVNFSATAYNSVVSAHERFVFIQLVNVLLTVALPIFNIVALYLGYGSLGMASMSLILTIASRIIYVLYVRYNMNIKPRYKSMPTNILKDVFSFSFWIFVSTIVSQIYTSTDTVIIGMIPKLATIGAAVYSIGYTFPSMVFSAAQIVPGFFTPRVTKMVFNGADDKSLTDMVIRVGRLQAYVVSLITFGFISFGRPFIQWYVGSGYEEAYWVAVIIMIPNCIPLVQSVAHSILQAKNMHRFRSITYLFIAIANIIGTILLVGKFGIIGAAIPTGISYIIGQGLIMNWYYWKKVKLDIPRFWKSIFPCFLIPAVMSVITLILYKFIDFYNFAHMIAGIMIFALVYAVVMWCLVLNKEEKGLILNKFANTKIVSKMINNNK
ncbi:MAG: hypothetical protein E7586_07030 [Ruminococcaceae bacterium]|nr:hypothetical protein [Oscillospiraceae bacterium]